MFQRRSLRLRRRRQVFPLFNRDQLTGNPYESSSTTSREASTGRVAPPFPWFAAGPVVGAAIGLTHIAAMVCVWAFHDYPDFFFRTPDWAWVGAIMMAIGGAIFGLPYGVALRLVMNSMSLSIRNRPNFYAAISASIVVTLISCEFSFQRSLLLNPLLDLSIVFVCAFAAAIATSQRMET